MDKKNIGKSSIKNTTCEHFLLRISQINKNNNYNNNKKLERFDNKISKYIRLNNVEYKFQYKPRSTGRAREWGKTCC